MWQNWTQKTKFFNFCLTVLPPTSCHLLFLNPECLNHHWDAFLSEVTTRTCFSGTAKCVPVVMVCKKPAQNHKRQQYRLCRPRPEPTEIQGSEVLAAGNPGTARDQIPHHANQHSCCHRHGNELPKKFSRHMFLLLKYIRNLGGSQQT